MITYEEVLALISPPKPKRRLPRRVRSRRQRTPDVSIDMTTLDPRMSGAQLRAMIGKTSHKHEMYPGEHAKYMFYGARGDWITKVLK